MDASSSTMPLYASTQSTLIIVVVEFRPSKDDKLAVHSATDPENETLNPKP
jgi:hypothetical protein